LIYPDILIFLLLLAAVIFIKMRRTQRVFVIAAFLVYAVAGNAWVSEQLVKSLEWRHLPQGDLPKADAIVTLSGGIEAKAYPRRTVEVGDRADRLLYAAWLYRQGKAPLIICTGGIVPGSTREHPYAEDMVTALEMVGIPRDAVAIETSSRNTYEHMVYCKKIFQQKHIGKILLVTSALHMPRAMAVFRQAGVTVAPAPTDFIVTRKAGKPTIFRRIMGALPNADNLLATKAALHEYIGMVYYRWRGWI
ncbi:MAG: YdcF family protein, partial [Deltaproteobacteria bacterium]|nr:YdcF family protein [Deltaproteobacteria bacterium]